MGLSLSRAEVVKGLEPVSNFTVHRVREVLETFEETCPSPALWERAFHELLGCFGSTQACSNAFQVMDTDGNGLVDAREVFAALAIVSKGHLNDRMTLLFDIFDLGGQRSMTFDECFLMLRRTIQGLKKAVGVVVLPDKVLHNMVRQIWKAAGVNRDARISCEDWTCWWTTDATVRSSLKMFTWAHDEYRGLPTPESYVQIDYALGTESEKGGAHHASVSSGSSKVSRGRGTLVSNRGSAHSQSNSRRQSRKTDDGRNDGLLPASGASGATTPR
eukprot:TRINITY_DN46331_c0_g1_i1.p1 TRINITY_DN46331_c0_g1~~TRINITY_DN46331_c0_g1_i1.p1  ORF type:complete len:312 (-),score=57.73 TRINITY_DN46331_c0_g1_i1:179-1000(-)